MMISSKKPYEIERAYTRIHVPHQNGTLTFVDRIFGPDTYAHNVQNIEQARLRLSTMGELVSLLYQAYIKDKKGREPEFKRIRDVAEDGFFGSTGFLAVPKKGVYVVDHPAVVRGRVSLQERLLIQRLEQCDPSVRFVPFGYATRWITPSTLKKHSLVLGSVGEEGTEKLAAITSLFPVFYLGAYDSIDCKDSSVAGFGAVSSRVGLDCSRRQRDFGAGLGVEHTGKASRAKK